jgi:hypothetical protein
MCFTAVIAGLNKSYEAIAYAADALEIWRKTPGALNWLSMNLLHDAGN